MCVYVYIYIYIYIHTHSHLIADLCMFVLLYDLRTDLQVFKAVTDTTGNNEDYAFCNNTLFCYTCDGVELEGVALLYLFAIWVTLIITGLESRLIPRLWRLCPIMA